MMRKYLQIGVWGGVIAACLIVLYWIILYGTGQNPFGQYKYLYFPIYGLCFIGTLYYARYRLNRGILRAQYALLTALLMNLFTSLFLGVMVWGVLKTSIGQHIKHRHIEQSLQLLESTKLYLEQRNETIVEFSPGNFETAQKQIRELSDVNFALDQSLGVAMSGIVFAFLFTLFFQKSPEK